LERRHKEAQEELRESEERCRQLFDNESGAVVLFDAETLQFEDANLAAFKLFGYSKSEFQKLCVLEISAEKNKAQTFIGGPGNGKTSNKDDALRYLVKRDGKTFPTEISAGTFMAAGRKKVIGAIRDITERHRKEEDLRLLFGDRSNAVEVVGSWTDITDMKQTEEGLRKSEQQFRDLIENSPVCIAIIRNSRVVYENPELKKNLQPIFVDQPD
jgi:PAS domain S-box-containing protein